MHLIRFCAFIALFAVPAFAGSSDHPETYLVSQYRIVIGYGAHGNTGWCSIAVGDDAEMPPAADHIMVDGSGKPKGITILTPAIIKRLKDEVTKMGYVDDQITQAYVDAWNKACP